MSIKLNVRERNRKDRENKKRLEFEFVLMPRDLDLARSAGVLDQTIILGALETEGAIF